jgi:hypothetical protein
MSSKQNKLTSLPPPGDEQCAVPTARIRENLLPHSSPQKSRNTSVISKPSPKDELKENVRIIPMKRGSIIQLPRPDTLLPRRHSSHHSLWPSDHTTLDAVVTDETHLKISKSRTDSPLGNMPDDSGDNMPDEVFQRRHGVFNEERMHVGEVPHWVDTPKLERTARDSGPNDGDDDERGRASLSCELVSYHGGRKQQEKIRECSVLQQDTFYRCLLRLLSPMPVDMKPFAVKLSVVNETFFPVRINLVCASRTREVTPRQCIIDHEVLVMPTRKLPPHMRRNTVAVKKRTEPSPCSDDTDDDFGCETVIHLGANHVCWIAVTQGWEICLLEGSEMDLVNRSGYSLVVSTIPKEKIPYPARLIHNDLTTRMGPSPQAGAREDGAVVSNQDRLRARLILSRPPGDRCQRPVLVSECISISHGGSEESAVRSWVCENLLEF